MHYGVAASLKANWSRFIGLKCENNEIISAKYAKCLCG